MTLDGLTSDRVAGCMRPLKLSGNQLKLIAVISMLLDHVGYLPVAEGCIIPRMTAGEPYGGWWILYCVLRMLGRAAFPIFCFLLVEGFGHTRDWRRYALRLGVFAVVSEVPFDLFAKRVPVNWETQNVFFVLLMGLLMLKCLQMMEARMRSELGLLLELTVIGLFSAAASLVRADYGYIGIMLIALIYWFRQDPVKMCLMGFVWMSVTLRIFYYLPGLAAGFLAIYCYSGQRGRGMGKYFFYVFYPVHMLLLVAVTAAVFKGICF